MDSKELIAPILRMMGSLLRMELLWEVRNGGGKMPFLLLGVCEFVVQLVSLFPITESNLSGRHCRSPKLIPSFDLGSLLL